MTTAFSIEGLVKSWDEFTLGPIDLDLETGVVLAFVGPNGSGKTTTLNCIAGLVKPEQGVARVFGRDVSALDVGWKSDVGYVGERQGFYLGMTVEQNLGFLGSFHPRWSQERAGDLCRRFRLDAGKRVKALSRGDRAKLALVAALGHSPRLLLLDEPTAGLDPVVRADVLDALWEILEEGDCSIFYSTHVLSDISRLADELAFLQNGKLLLRRDKEALTDAWRRVSFRHAAFDSSGIPDIFGHQRDGTEHQILSSDHESTVEHLRDSGAENIRETRLTIDEIAVAILRGNYDVETDQS